MEHEYATKAKANADLNFIRNRLPKRNARFLELAEAIKMR